MSDHSEYEPIGIGGWLVFPAIGLLLNPIFSFAAFAVMHEDSLSRPPGSAGALFIQGSILALLMFELYVAVVFFMKKPFVPPLMVVYIGLHSLHTLVLAGIGWAHNLPLPGDTMWITSLVIAAIWIPYFCVSKRVRNTFSGDRVLVRGSSPAAPTFEGIESYSDWLDLDIVQREKLKATLTSDQRERLREMEFHHYGVEPRETEE